MANEELKARIEDLEKELSTTKVNKRTEAAVGLLKAKIARLKEELEQKSAKGPKGEGYAVKKEGDATVGLLGKPSVGKSTLLSAITNKESKIGAYEFTTLEVIPGLLNYKHTNLQILDLPGIIKHASQNKGFGRKVLSVVRACDLIVFIVDARHIDEMDMLLEEIRLSGIRVNTSKPFIQIIRQPKGSITIPINHSEDRISSEFIKEVLLDNGLVNAEVMIHEENLTEDDFIDALYGNLEYTQGAICLNKIDLFSEGELREKVSVLKERYPNFPLYGISAEMEINLEGFKEFIWKNLGFIWVYLKEQRKEADMTRPLVVQRGDSVRDVCLKIHKDILKKFKFARVKGSSVKFEWQRVGLDHLVEDKDIVEIYAR
ncbi:50S ribosome-binding GTPase [Candidatus Woesearchaeota archaeon]|nr:50S ribosome-binding GTPase [Nanoarchaeota archaeon]MCB9370241.1 50S ribosome-binding GTPase [Candidatus Woesearchaeota archaeon]USN44766.1 MAG: 50S ribosome-binding GTPase [Candidatus Woesearchaeota archaeon]